MDSSIKSFQSFASNILDIELPDSSTSFIAFNRVKIPDMKLQPIKVDKKPIKFRKNTNNSKNLSKVQFSVKNSQEELGFSRINRSYTTVFDKNLDKTKINLKNTENIRLKLEKKKLVNPILFKLNAKLQPKIVKYNIKQLKSQTLLYQTEKGLVSCQINANSPLAAPIKKKFHKSSPESSNQLLLTTENSLSDYYMESIRIQNNLRRRELEKKMDAQVYKTLTNKLSSINQSIINEQSRIARSFYSL
jgi:hypothetical protein